MWPSGRGTQAEGGGVGGHMSNVRLCVRVCARAMAAKTMVVFEEKRTGLKRGGFGEERGNGQIYARDGRCNRVIRPRMSGSGGSSFMGA